MKKFINIFASIKLSINILFAISFLFILAYKLFFLSIPEIFLGTAVIGEIFYNISLALVASYVFYLIVIHLKDFGDKKIVYKVVINKLDGLVNVKNYLLRELTNASKISVEKNDISENLIKNIFLAINPNDNAPLVFYSKVSETSWITFFNFYNKSTLNTIKEIYQFISFLDLSLLEIFYKIETSKFISHLKPFDEHANYTYPDLSPFAKSFYDYIQMIDELELYINRNKKLYV